MSIASGLYQLPKKVEYPQQPVQQPVDQAAPQPAPAPQPTTTDQIQTSYNPTLDEFGYNPHNPEYDKIKNAQQLVDLAESSPFVMKQFGDKYTLQKQIVDRYKDYELAQRTAAEDQARLDATLAKNRPTVETPGGTQEWVTDPVTGQVTLKQTLDPAGQEIFDQNRELEKQIGEFRQDVFSDVKDAIGSPLDIQSEVGAYTGPEGDIPTFAAPQGDLPTLDKTKPQDLPQYNQTGQPVPTFSSGAGETPVYSFQGDVPGYNATNTPIPTYNPQGDVPDSSGFLKGLGAFQDYQGPQGEMPTYNAPGGNVPTLNRPDGDVPQYVGPEGDTPRYEGMSEAAPNYDDIKTNVRDSILARAEEDINRDREQKHAQLVARGIPPNSEAYNTEMQRFERQLTDARQQAEITSSQIASTEYQNRLAGRRQGFAEHTAGFDNDMISAQFDLAKTKQDFVSRMQSRGMTFDEATRVYESQMEGRRLQGDESYREYGAQMEGRRLAGDEARTQFDADTTKRRVLTDEEKARWGAGIDEYQMQDARGKDVFDAGMQTYSAERQAALDKYSADVQQYGMESDQAQRTFDNSMRSVGLDLDRAQQQFGNDMESYQAERQKALEDFSVEMQQYGISRQEAKDMFDSEMQKRNQDFEERLATYESEMAGRRQEVDEGVTKFNADLEKQKQEISKALIERQTPLNELSILAGGQQVSIPQFMQGGSAVAAPGADYLGISQFQQSKDLQIKQMLTNLQIAQQQGDTAKMNNIVSGLFDLGISLAT